MHSPLRAPASFGVVLAALLGSMTTGAPAHAGDGVLEINQTCATQTGCFPGDSAGFPVTISVSGTSYRLTSSLLVPDANTDGINFSTSLITNVSIDLGGFEIKGPVVCSIPPACTPNTGSGSGIEGFGTGNRAISVRNGSITGMGNFGILLGEQSMIEDMRIRQNRSTGIALFNGSIVSNSNVQYNGGDGIGIANGGRVSGCVAMGNGDDGIVITFSGVVEGSTAYDNVGSGIEGSSGVTISDNSSYSNGSVGIAVGAASTVHGNSAFSNTGAGIATATGSLVHGNVVRGNGGYGLDLGQESGYRENLVSNNTLGTVNGTLLVNMGNNACEASTTCP